MADEKVFYEIKLLSFTAIDSWKRRLFYYPRFRGVASNNQRINTLKTGIFSVNSRNKRKYFCMIWNNEKIKLFNADCFDIFPQIADKSVDLILADLPYGTTACKWDTILPFDKLWQAYERIIKDNGAIVLTASQPFTSALVMSNPKKFKYQWVWEKGTASNFANANYQPLKSHEDVLVFGSFPASPTKKGLKNYNPQFEKGKPYICKAGLQRSDSYLRTGAASLRGGNYQTINDGFRYPKSVIKISKDKDKLHPTQKPVELMEYLIKTYTNEGDLVLDNTFGSGTTAVACQNLNRHFVGMEKEKKYFDIAVQRLTA